VPRPSCGSILSSYSPLTVGDVGDLGTVRRPRGCAFVGACGVGEIACVALLDGHGDDLAAVFERGADRGGRDGNVSHIAIALHEAWPSFAQVGRDADGEPTVVLRYRWIQQVEIARLLIDNLAGAHAEVEHGESACVVRRFTFFVLPSYA